MRVYGSVLNVWGMSHRSAHPPIALSLPLRLESHPQTELNVAALLAAAGQDSPVGCDGRISPGEEVRARIDEQVRVVEEVEEFGAELQVHAFARELDALVQPEIESKVTRGAEQVERREKLRLQVGHARRAGGTARGEVVQSAESDLQPGVEVEGVRKGGVWRPSALRGRADEHRVAEIRLARIATGDGAVINGERAAGLRL